MGVDRGTLRRLEQGDPGVSLNTLAMGLSAVGMMDRLVEHVEQATDDVGLLVSRDDIPKRVSRPRRKPTPAPQAPRDEPEDW